MCSASKVKCNKEKPICSRCSKLDYTCSYSPARRMGRPHPARGTSTPNGSRAAHSAKRQSTSRRSRKDSTETESHSSTAEQETSPQLDIQDGTTNNARRADNDFNDDILNFQDSTMPQNRQSNCPQADGYSDSVSPRIQRKVLLENTYPFDFEHYINKGPGIEGEGLYRQGMISNGNKFSPDSILDLDYHCDVTARNGQLEYPLYRDPSIELLDGMDWQAAASHETSTYLPNSAALDSSSTSTDNQFGSMLRHLGDIPFPTPEGDCATIAMNLLQHLHMICMKQQQATSIASSTVESDLASIPSPALDSLLDAVSMAINQVSIILTCPCSQKTDIGLLTAAVCGAILRTYRIIFRNNSKVNGAARDVEKACLEAVRAGLDEQVTTIRILGELPRVANLVTQYSRRYTSAEAEERSSADLPSALAADLRSKLKSTSSEATDWLIQVHS